MHTSFAATAPLVANARTASIEPRSLQLRDGRIATLRPVRADDAERMRDFVEHGLSAEARRLRFHHGVNGCSAGLLRDLLAGDGERRVVRVATLTVEGVERIVAEARCVIDDGDDDSAEFAIAVADACRGLGVADRLIEALLDAARERGLRWLHGDVLADNARMLAFMQRMGFAVRDGGLEGALESAGSTVRVERSVGRPLPPIALRPAPLSMLRRWLHEQLGAVARRPADALLH